MGTTPQIAREDAGPEPASAQPGRGRGPGRRFAKGTSGNPSGKRKDEPPPEGLEARPGETQLDAMRWVLTNPEPRTFQQWQMAQWLKADRERFMAAKVALERTALPTPEGSTGTSAGEGPVGSCPTAPDLGTERCLELARALLEKYGVKPA